MGEDYHGISGLNRDIQQGLGITKIEEGDSQQIDDSLVIMTG